MKLNTYKGIPVRIVEYSTRQCFLIYIATNEIFKKNGVTVYRAYDTGYGVTSSKSVSYYAMRYLVKEKE